MTVFRGREAIKESLEECDRRLSEAVVIPHTSQMVPTPMNNHHLPRTQAVRSGSRDAKRGFLGPGIATR